MDKNTNQFTKRGLHYPIVDGHRTLHSKYYHDEDIFKEEAQKIFYKYWIYACREEEIPSIGDFRVLQVVEESIIIVRDELRHVKAHFNVCRHRGTQLCTEPSGNFVTRTIQCPYHAWTYSLNGQLSRAPLMKEENGFSKKECALFQAHVHIWEGFVFISLDENPQPFEIQMEALIGKFAKWHLSDLRIAHHIRYDLNCNWKLILQNYQECYHCPGVHPLLCEWTPFDSAEHDYSKGAVIGGFMNLTKKRGSMTMDGSAAGPPIGEIDDRDLQRVYYYSIFPNMLLTPHPDFVLFHHIMPVGPGKIINDCYWLFHPDVIQEESARARIESAVQFWDMTNKQDWAVCEQMQSGTKSKRFSRGYYSGREDILLALDKEVLKALGHH